jgi:tetratricopeptide (TPR) repeat protein
MKAIKGAIKKRPGLLHARTTLGEHLVATGDLAGAQKVFEDALAINPLQPWVLVQVGKLKAKQGDIDGAIATTDKALALVPDDAVVLMEKASRLIDGRRYKDAEATLRAAMAADPRLAAAYLRLGYVYLETNQLSLAGPILNKALYEADRESERRIKGYAHYDLAKLHARLGDPDRAVTEIGRAVAAGFNERQRFDADKDLVEVRKLPAYQTLFPEADDNKPDDNKPDDNKPDDNKPDDNKPDDNKPDDNKPDDNKAKGNNKADDSKPDDNKADDNKAKGDKKAKGNKAAPTDKKATGDKPAKASP